MSTALPRLEDHVRMFHAACGGIVTGPLDDLTCAECGQQMMAFVSAAEETKLADAAQPVHGEAEQDASEQEVD